MLSLFWYSGDDDDDVVRESPPRVLPPPATTAVPSVAVLPAFEALSTQHSLIAGMRTANSRPQISTGPFHPTPPRSEAKSLYAPPSPPAVAAFVLRGPVFELPTPLLLFSIESGATVNTLSSARSFMSSSVAAPCRSSSSSSPMPPRKIHASQLRLLVYLNDSLRCMASAHQRNDVTSSTLSAHSSLSMRARNCDLRTLHMIHVNGLRPFVSSIPRIKGK